MRTLGAGGEPWYMIGLKEKTSVFWKSLYLQRMHQGRDVSQWVCTIHIQLCVSGLSEMLFWFASNGQRSRVGFLFIQRKGNVSNGFSEVRLTIRYAFSGAPPVFLTFRPESYCFCDSSDHGGIPVTTMPSAHHHSEEWLVLIRERQWGRWNFGENSSVWWLTCNWAGKFKKINYRNICKSMHLGGRVRSSRA